MSLTFDQLHGWRPHDLVEVAGEWTNLANALDGVFDRYANALVRTTDGGYWQGSAADAAQQRAGEDRRHLADMTDQVRGLSTLLNENWYGIEAALQRAKGGLAGLRDKGYNPSGDTSVSLFCSRITSMMVNGKTFKELPETDQLAILRLAVDLNDGAAAAKSADDSLRQQLELKAAGLPAMFTSAAALGTGQGSADATDLVNGTFSPADVARLVDAGTLPADQLAALQAGQDITVPASTMQYMTELARGLDGKSPQEIQQIMDKLPPEGKQALSNSLNLVSNERVKAGPAGNGSFDKLPTKVRESLTRDDLVVTGTEVGQGYRYDTVKLNGVADNQAIAAIVSAGDDRYQQGSTLDRNLLDVGRQYLNAQVAWEQDPDKAFTALTVDGQPFSGTPVTEPIMQAVGDDKIAVEQVLSGGQGKDFVTDMLVHDWTDDGKAASTLFTFNDGDAVVTDPNNPVDVGTAHRTGNIMSMVGEWVSTDEQWQKFADVGDNQSAGERNPALIQGLSTSMSPYVSALAGDNHRTDLPGFDTMPDGKSWIDPDNRLTFDGSRRVFALMNTDEVAGKQFTGAAMEQVLRYEADYAQNPQRSGVERNLEFAGALNGISDRGLQDGLQASVDNKNDIAQEAYARKSAAYDALKAGTQFLATGTGLGAGANPLIAEGFNRVADGGGNPLKDAIIGAAPTATGDVELRPPNFTLRNYEVLTRMDISQDLRNEYPQLFNGGTLKSWQELSGTGDSSGPNFTPDLNELMGRVGDPQVFVNAYNRATLGAAS
ncbi:WXG100 family type VII secretion target [Nocardia sp. NPDC003979]